MEAQLWRPIHAAGCCAVESTMALKRSFGLALALFVPASLAASAQSAIAPARPAVSRLAGDWHITAAVRLSSSRPPLPSAETDLGAAPPNARMNRMLLLLAPAPAQQRALAAELASLQNPASAEYHHWLTPEAFANAYSNSASDVAAAVAWLESEGFTVARLPAGRGWIEFSGTVTQVEQAFQTRVDRFETASGARAALAGSISVPGALSPLIQGLVSLDGAVSAPALTAPQPVGGSVAELAAKTSFDSADPLTPLLTAQLLHLDAVHAAGIVGTGETIAIPAPSDVNSADFSGFRAAFGLPPLALKVVPDGPDPGLTAAQAEATLAAEWAGAAAPAAQIVLVPTATTSATDGVDLSLAAIVDGGLAQTVAVGFSGCEPGMSAAHQQFYSALYRQAAAEGITIVAAAGDSGPAACQSAGTSAPVTSGYAVNALASTPWNTAVGVAGFGAAGPASGNAILTAWSPARAADPGYAGGGGSSTVYAGPSWQPVPPPLAQGVGGAGVHNRLMPDLALPTALDPDADPGLAFCLTGSAQPTPGCTPVRSGGSAAATALFAGVAALIEQKYGAQGNIAPNLYDLSRYSAANGAFNDVAQGSAQLPCAAGSPGCEANGEIGYTAFDGFDLATGLGVPNVQVLVNRWATSQDTGTGAVSVTLSVSPIEANSTYNPSTTITLTANVISLTGGGTPTGTVTFFNTATNAPVSAAPAALDSNGNATLTVEGVFTDGGNEIDAQYSGDSSYKATTSQPPVNINVEPSTTSLTVVPSNDNPAPGQTITITVTLTVGSPPAGSVAPSGGVTLNLDGLPTQSAAPVTSNGTTTASFSLTVPASSTQLTHTLQAVYTGDANYSGSTSPQVTVTVSKTPTTLTITPATTTPTAGSSLAVAATVNATQTGSLQPSGSFSLTMDGSAAGSVNVTPGSPSTASVTIPVIAAGTHVLQGTYSGDSTYAGSTSSAVTITATKGATVTTVTATPPVLAAGTTETLTATIAPANAAAGTTYTITGTVSFYDSGTTLLGTALVSSNVATLAGVTLADTLSHTITAVYSGDANWLTSTSAVLSLPATTKPDYVLLAANVSAVGPGQSLVLTATVTPDTTPAAGAEPNPTGIVIFYAGTTAIGTAELAANPLTDSSTASLTSQTLPGGQDTLSAVYQGDLYYEQATSNLLTLDVQGFSITPSSTNPATNLNIAQGSSGSASFVVTGLGGFNNEVQIVCAVPQQDDMTCTVSPQQVVPPATVTFVVQTFTSGGPAYATTASRGAAKPLWPRTAGAALAGLFFFLLPYARRTRIFTCKASGCVSKRLIVLLLLLVGLGGAGIGCNSVSSPAIAGTPLGVSTLKITGSAYINNTVVSQSVYLTVNVLAKGQTAP